MIPRSDIADYKENDLRVLHGIENFYKSLRFADATVYAASGADPHGKTNPHQRRIGVKRFRKSARLLKKRLPEIQRAKSFSDLFAITEEIKSSEKGLDDLWSYDTALRMAFSRGRSFYPQAVFVQAGVVKGVKKAFPQWRMRGRTLPVSKFPKAIQQLEAFEIENFLCVWGKQE